MPSEKSKRKAPTLKNCVFSGQISEFLFFFFFGDVFLLSFAEKLVSPTAADQSTLLLPAPRPSESMWSHLVRSSRASPCVLLTLPGLKVMLYDLHSTCMARHPVPDHVSLLACPVKQNQGELCPWSQENSLVSNCLAQSGT